MSSDNVGSRSWDDTDVCATKTRWRGDHSHMVLRLSYPEARGFLFNAVGSVRRHAALPDDLERVHHRVGSHRLTASSALKVGLLSAL